MSMLVYTPISVNLVIKLFLLNPMFYYIIFMLSFASKILDFSFKTFIEVNVNFRKNIV